MGELSMRDAFELGQHGHTNNFLYSSPMWFAFEAGRAAATFLEDKTLPLSVAMSRGYSVKVKGLRGGTTAFRFTGDPLVVDEIEGAL